MVSIRSMILCSILSVSPQVKYSLCLPETTHLQVLKGAQKSQKSLDALSPKFGKLCIESNKVRLSIATDYQKYGVWRLRQFLYKYKRVLFIDENLIEQPLGDCSISEALLNAPPKTEDLNPEEHIEFWHYLVDEPSGRLITTNCVRCLKRFIPTAPTVFIVHGFTDNHLGPLGNSILKAFAKKSDPINMVTVDWHHLAKQPNYPQAARNVKVIGKHVAKMIQFLIEEKVASLEKIIYIGHSLGAHVANSVSANLPRNNKLARIFALDPALPLFDTLYSNEKDRIDPSDGDFVIVLHTSGAFGIQEPVGHVDFYSNSGKRQPGCSGIFLSSCSHCRAVYLMAESIHRPQAFPACKCDSWENYEAGNCKCNKTTFFTLDTPDTLRGKYYFETNGHAPYGQGMKRKRT